MQRGPDLVRQHLLLEQAGGVFFFWQGHKHDRWHGLYRGGMSPVWVVQRMQCNSSDTFRQLSFPSAVSLQSSEDLRRARFGSETRFFRHAELWTGLACLCSLMSLHAALIHYATSHGFEPRQRLAVTPQFSVGRGSRGASTRHEMTRGCFDSLVCL